MSTYAEHLAVLFYIPLQPSLISKAHASVAFPRLGKGGERERESEGRPHGLFCESTGIEPFLIFGLGGHTHTDY